MSAPDSSAKSMRTPLGRVRYLGSAHSGTRDFWRQRLTAVAMTLLIVPVIVVVMMLLGRNQAGAAQILGSPLVALILLLFIVASALNRPGCARRNAPTAPISPLTAFFIMLSRPEIIGRRIWAAM